MNAIASFTDGLVGFHKSYDKKSWNAQIRHIVETRRGYEAAAKVGLSVKKDTLLTWLAWAGEEDPAPSKANQEKIAKAYALLRGRQWPREVERMSFAITGQVTMGSDTRVRGRDGNAALLIDGSQASANDWEPMRSAWDSGSVSASQFEEDFKVIVEADIGESSEPIQFDGNDYVVEVS